MFFRRTREERVKLKREQRELEGIKTEGQKQAKLNEVSEILRKHGIYLECGSHVKYLQIYYGGDHLVDILNDDFHIELGETDSDKGNQSMTLKTILSLVGFTIALAVLYYYFGHYLHHAF